MNTRKTTVAAVGVKSYHQEEVQAGLAEALALIGGVAAFIEPGDRVLIKPNMLEALSPDKAVTTHPEVVTEIPFSII